MQYIVCWRLFRDQPTQKIYVATLAQAEKEVADAALQGVKAWIANNFDA